MTQSVQSRAPARAGVPAFAGLRSLLTGGARVAEDPADPDKEDEARTARRAEEDERREKEDARRAEEDKTREEEDARRAEEDVGEEDDKEKDKRDTDGKKGRKAKGKTKGEDYDEEECEEEDDPDAKVAQAARAGRLAERARWANALDKSTPATAAAACVMLASSEMHSSAVIAAAKSLPAPEARTGRARLDERMGAVRTPIISSDGGSAPDPESPEAKAAAILLAGKKRRGEA